MANQTKACALLPSANLILLDCGGYHGNIVMQHLLSFLWQVSGVRVQRENKNDNE